MVIDSHPATFDRLTDQEIDLTSEEAPTDTT